MYIWPDHCRPGLPEPGGTKQGWQGKCKHQGRIGKLLFSSGAKEQVCFLKVLIPWALIICSISRYTLSDIQSFFYQNN